MLPAFNATTKQLKFGIKQTVVEEEFQISGLVALLF
jgi:hypothetical protein